jgi:gamma-glutamyltranspeptidase
MIRIEISAAANAANAALAASATRGLMEPHRSSTGGFHIWLDRMTLNRLVALRAPGEDYSDTIIRLAREKVAT